MISRALEDGATRSLIGEKEECEGVRNVTLHRGRGENYWRKKIAKAELKYGESVYNPSLWEKVVDFYALTYARMLHVLECYGIRRNIEE